MKPFGAARLVCRGLRCRALTTANEVWLGFYNNEDYAWFREKEKTNSKNYVLAVLAF